ncbi:hypothetical protein HAX54_002129 [Datura stramonium]|uniref:Uncharacterized protein n=1 Tax=Datura stramonium TaxID=4076 RepID=A0ABS8T3F8_DATST|nr:hypothetical protein [Datura stramonium]
MLGEGVKLPENEDVNIQDLMSCASEGGKNKESDVAEGYDSEEDEDDDKIPPKLSHGKGKGEGSDEKRSHDDGKNGDTLKQRQPFDTRVVQEHSSCLTSQQQRWHEKSGWKNPKHTIVPPIATRGWRETKDFVVPTPQ